MFRVRVDMTGLGRGTYVVRVRYRIDGRRNIKIHSLPHVYWKSQGR